MLKNVWSPGNDSPDFGIFQIFDVQILAFHFIYDLDPSLYLVMATYLETLVKTVSRSSSLKLVSNSWHNDWMNQEPDALK